jgi:hypothetical protein
VPPALLVDFVDVREAPVDQLHAGPEELRGVPVDLGDPLEVVAGREGVGPEELVTHRTTSRCVMTSRPWTTRHREHAPAWG